MTAVVEGVAWCPTCRTVTLPLGVGFCGFCDTATVPHVPDVPDVPAPVKHGPVTA